MRHADGIHTSYPCLLSFCGGVIALRFASALPPWPLAAAFAFGLLLAAIRFHWLRPAAAFALGFCWAAVFATLTFNASLPPALEKKDVSVHGRVLGVPTVRGVNQRFDFKVEQLNWRGKNYPAPGKIRLRMYTAQPQILSGQRWSFTVRLKRAHGFQNPGALFNYETYLFHHRLRATGYVRAEPPPQLLSQPPAWMPSSFRQRVAIFIRDTLGEDSRAGLVTALSVGLRNDMRARDWEVLTRTGTIHLVAISGLHIGLVSALVLLFASRIWRFAGALPLRLPAPKFGILAGLFAGLVYAMLAGMTIPTRRAACMLAVVALAMFFQRRPFGGETLALALAAVLLLDPLAPLAGGFWLSFGAVVVLVMGAAHFQPSAAKKPSSSTLAVSPVKLMSSLATVMAESSTAAARRAYQTLHIWSATQIVLFIGMAPLLLILFHRVSLSAPLANLIAIPPIGLLAVPAALCGLLFYALGLESAAAVAFAASNFVIEKVWIALEIFSAMPGSVWLQPSPPAWALPPAVIGICLLLSPRATPARATGFLWLLPLFFNFQNLPAPGEFRYTMLDVGNGLASVVQTQNHFLVYDAGAHFSSGFDIGDAVVAPFLRRQGASMIDALVLSHGDNDHAGGGDALLAQFKVDKTFAGESGVAPSAIRCAAGQSWTWDGVEFSFVWPPPLTSLHGNDASCVLKITSRFGSLLLTGDIGESVEAMLAAAKIKVDVLQAPHHGSKTSSTENFLIHVNPQIALASAGYLNGYGHPHRSVRARYARHRIPLYNTATEGAIGAAFTAAGIALQSHRANTRGFWIAPAVALPAAVRIAADVKTVSLRE